MTQKEFGIAIEFDEKTADIRVTQYESGIPKANYVKSMLKPWKLVFCFKCSQCIQPLGLTLTLFALEDIHGIKINSIGGELCLTLDKENSSYTIFFEMLNDWEKQTAKYKNNEINKEKYDN